MKPRAIAAFIALFICTYALAQTALLSGATGTGAGAWFPVVSGAKTFQYTAVSTAGTGTAVIQVQCSIDGVNSVNLGTGTFTTGTTTVATSILTSTDACRLVRGNVSSIAGTTTVGLFLNQ